MPDLQDSSLPLRMTGTLGCRAQVVAMESGGWDGVEGFQFGDPELYFGVGWHAEIAAGGEADRADLRAVGHAGAFELLAEEPPVELF